MADKIFAVLDEMVEDPSADMGRSLEAVSVTALLLTRNFICFGVCGVASVVTLYMLYRKYRSTTELPRPTASIDRSQQPPFQELMNLGELQSMPYEDTRARPAVPRGRWYCSWQLFAMLGFVLLTAVFARLAVAQAMEALTGGGNVTGVAKGVVRGTTTTFAEEFQAKFDYEVTVDDFNPPNVLVANEKRLEIVGSGLRESGGFDIYKAAYYIDSEQDVSKVPCTAGNVGWHVEVVAHWLAIKKVPGVVKDLLSKKIKSLKKDPDTVLKSLVSLWTVSKHDTIQMIAPPGGKLQYVKRAGGAGEEWYDIPNNNTVEDDQVVLEALCDAYFKSVAEDAFLELRVDVKKTLGIK